MTKEKPRSQGAKTMEQQKRTLEGKPDMPRKDAEGRVVGDADEAPRPAKKMNLAARQSEFPVSQRGMNQESQHHKPERE